MILLQTIDTRWKEHLAMIDQLKEGINLRAYAQKDPLIEYKKESFKAFETMNHVIKSETIEKLLKIQVVAQDEARQAMVMEEMDESHLDFSGSDDTEIGGFLPTMEPQARSQEMSFSGAGGAQQDEGPKLNRAERRRREKLKKRRR